MQEEKDLLQNGLQYAIPPVRLNKTDIFATFELIGRCLLKNLKDSKDSGKVKAELSHLANSYFYNYEPTKATVRKHKLLNRLKKNKDIVITYPDKGNGVVILDRKKYDDSIDGLISDTTKFKKLKDDVTLQREGKLQRFLRTLKKKGFFEDSIYDGIYPKGSNPARIYGLPKLHKSFPAGTYPPFRPIVSSIGTYNYKLSKFLCTLLNPLISNEHSTKDTFTFVEDIKKL